MTYRGNNCRIANNTMVNPTGCPTNQVSRSWGNIADKLKLLELIFTRSQNNKLPLEGLNFEIVKTNQQFILTNF